MEKKIEMISPHFSYREMACRCKRPKCGAKGMNRYFMRRLEDLREMYGKPLIPTSAARCSFWNNHVGGAPASFHLHGRACDFFFPSFEEVKEFAILAEKAGFRGIGIGKKKIHIDDRRRFTRWTYF